MATVSARLAVLGENAPIDQEKDANSLVLELEKGLRSTKVGEKCEAIVRFPVLFEKYPFPIFINSAFLKLADVFREGTNNLRYQILRVAQQSVKHLDKILSVDEFLQRIFYVIHSNQAVARAITLRTLGSVARIISERKNVHHSIINSLDSHDTIELEAAIFAAERFTEESKSFSISICNKLPDMISGLATPIDMKLKLIPIFQHMHRDPSTTEKARQLCMELIEHNPARDVVLVTLHTLSQLAAKSLLDIPQQVALLLRYVKHDPRHVVQVVALKQLRRLADTGAHMWQTQHIQTLCDYIKTLPNDSLKIGALNVLTTLSGSVAVTKFDLTEGSESAVCVAECCYHLNMLVACRACRLLTDVAVFSATSNELRNDGNIMETACLAVECLLATSCSELTDPCLPALKSCLLCVGKLCEASPNTIGRFVDNIVTTLANVPTNYALLLCQCLSSISSKQNVRLHSLMSDFLDLLRTQLTQQTKQHALKVSLVTLLFQACVGNSAALHEAAEAVLNNVLEQVDCWTAYQIGRQAARYGHHQVAAHVFGSLTSKVSTENFDYWLSAVCSCCEAEACLLDTNETVAMFIKRVTAATNHYQKGLAALKAATMPGQQLIFQCKYIQLRIRLLLSCVQLVKSCRSFQTSPPPAIASSLAVTTGSDLHRCNHVLRQLEKCVKQFEELSKGYHNLYQCSFDADQGALANIKIFQHSCQVIIYVLNTILANAKKPGSAADIVTTTTHPTHGSMLVLQPLIDCNKSILTELKHVCGLPADLPLIHQHMQCIIDAAFYLCSVPLCFPRYFFQRLQNTEIKLAISPQPKSSVDVLVNYDTNLTLKVEGVIQHSSRPGLFRKLQSVQVSVKSSLTTRAQMISESKVTESTTNELIRCTEPHNDYFSTQFLLSFPVAGLHQVNIEVSVLDEQKVLWNTGPCNTITVKSNDDAVQRQQQQQYAAQRQQSRALKAL